MEKRARIILVYALTGIMSIGIWAPIAQAASYNRQRDDQQREERQQRPNVQRQQQQQRQYTQQQQQQRQYTQQQRQVYQREEQQRQYTQQQQQQRQYTQQQQQQRQGYQRAEQQRQYTQQQQQQQLYNQRHNDREWQNRYNPQRSHVIRRQIYSHDRYHSHYWRPATHIYEYKRPWSWYSRNHFGRRLINDLYWNREFPGLRSYYWRGSGFWYRGMEYTNLVLFYDDGDSLVAIGFWDRGQFIMIRDDDSIFYNNSPFVLGYHRSILQLNIRL